MCFNHRWLVDCPGSSLLGLDILPILRQEMRPVKVPYPIWMKSHKLQYQQSIGHERVLELPLVHIGYRLAHYY